jgi:hypothetical protein
MTRAMCRQVYGSIAHCIGPLTIALLYLAAPVPAEPATRSEAVQAQAAAGSDAARFARAKEVFTSPRQPESISLFSELIDDLRARANRRDDATQLLLQSLAFRAQARMNLGQIAEADEDVKASLSISRSFRPTDPVLSPRLRERYDILASQMPAPVTQPARPTRGPWTLPRRIIAGFNRGYTVPWEHSRSGFDFTLYNQSGRTDADYTVAHGLNAYDYGVAGRIWGPLALGINYSVVTATSSGDIDSRIPHPVSTAAPRNLQASVTDLNRTEHTLHIEIRATKGGRKFEGAFFAGPSLFKIRQDIVSNVVFRDFAGAVTFLSADTKEVLKESVLGLHVGVDVSGMIVPVIGFGVFARYSVGEGEFADGRDTGLLKVGGFQTGGGLRIRF